MRPSHNYATARDRDKGAEPARLDFPGTEGEARSLF